MRLNICVKLSLFIGRLKLSKHYINDQKSQSVLTLRFIVYEISGLSLTTLSEHASAVEYTILKIIAENKRYGVTILIAYRVQLSNE